jgi:hypothetical protein
MLFPERVLHGIAEGRVTLAFRRWHKAPPKPGSTLRTPVGVVTFGAVTPVEDGDITPDDVRRTGLSLGELRASLEGDGTLLRIELRLSGADPRIGLRDQRPSPEEVAAILARLARFDGAADTPWTAAYLGLIAERPATLARALASSVGAELVSFKRRVRQLKELGLTESLEIGYRLSTRGEVVMTALSSRD